MPISSGPGEKTRNKIEYGRGSMNLWDRILVSVQHKMNSQTFNTWLRPTQQLSASDGTLQIEVPSVIFADWIHKNFMPLIQESARELEVGDLRLQFTSRDHQGARRMPSSVNPGLPQPAAGPPVSPAAAPPGGINQRYNFSSFVVSSCNQFAHAAALA